MKLLNAILLIFTIISCNSDSQMAAEDIMWQSLASDSTEYWEYAQFIQYYPESYRFEEALNLYFNKRQKEWGDEIPILDCLGRCPKLKVQDSVIFFQLDSIPFDSIRPMVFKFIRNHKDDIFGPQEKDITIPGSTRLGEIRLGFVQIVFSDKVDYKRVQEVTAEVSYGFQDYKKVLAKDWFFEDYEDLNQTLKTKLDSMNSGRLIFWKVYE